MTLCAKDDPTSFLLLLQRDFSEASQDSLTEVLDFDHHLEVCFNALGNKERDPGSLRGLLPCPAASAADLRGDETRGLSPPRRLSMPVTNRCRGEMSHEN